MPNPTSAQYKRRLLREVAISTDATAYVPLNSAGVTLDKQTTELVTQGTTQKYRDETTSSYTITLDQQVYEDALNQLALGASTTGVIGVSKRYHGTGLPQATAVELRLKIDMVALADGTTVTEHVRFLKCTVRSYDPFTSAAAEAIVPGQIVLEAQQTLVDIAGAAVAGAVAPGDFYVVDVQAAA